MIYGPAAPSAMDLEAEGPGAPPGYHKAAAAAHKADERFPLRGTNSQAARANAALAAHLKRREMNRGTQRSLRLPRHHGRADSGREVGD